MATQHYQNYILFKCNVFLYFYNEFMYFYNAQQCAQLLAYGKFLVLILNSCSVNIKILISVFPTLFCDIVVVV